MENTYETRIRNVAKYKDRDGKEKRSAGVSIPVRIMEFLNLKEGDIIKISIEKIANLSKTEPQEKEDEN